MDDSVDKVTDADEAGTDMTNTSQEGPAVNSPEEALSDDLVTLADDDNDDEDSIEEAVQRTSNSSHGTGHRGALLSWEEEAQQEELGLAQDDAAIMVIGQTSPVSLVASSLSSLDVDDLYGARLAAETAVVPAEPPEISLEFDGTFCIASPRLPTEEEAMDAVGQLSWETPAPAVKEPSQTGKPALHKRCFSSLLSHIPCSPLHPMSLPFHEPTMTMDRPKSSYKLPPIERIFERKYNLSFARLMEASFAHVVYDQDEAGG